MTPIEINVIRLALDTEVDHKDYAKHNLAAKLILNDRDHGKLAEWTDNPRLKNTEDIYYRGIGQTWDTDLDGMRYWLQYNSYGKSDERYNHLSLGDIIDEKARVKQIVMECLSEVDTNKLTGE